MSEPMFPILNSAREMAGDSFPASIPWSVIGPHEKQALRNHDQTLNRLAQRGGLSWSEIELILLNRSWDGRMFILPREREVYRAHERAAAERVSKLIAEITPTPLQGG